MCANVCMYLCVSVFCSYVVITYNTYAVENGDYIIISTLENTINMRIIFEC